MDWLGFWTGSGSSSGVDAWTSHTVGSLPWGVQISQAGCFLATDFVCSEIFAPSAEDDFHGFKAFLRGIAILNEHACFGIPSGRQHSEYFSQHMPSTHPSTPFMDLHLDSYDMVQVTQKLRTKLDGDLPATLLFDHPTFEALSKACAEKVSILLFESATLIPSEMHAIRIADSCSRSPAGTGNGVSIPGLLCSSVDASRSIPPRTFEESNAAYVLDDIYVFHGYFLDKVQCFDAAWFGISSREISAVDPNHRVLLETATQAWFAAGHSKITLMDAQFGVLVGLGSDLEWSVRVVRSCRMPGTYYAHGPHAAAAAERLSYLLGLKGPSLIVVTACFSSLVALNIATLNLQSDKCSHALAAGISIMFDRVLMKPQSSKSEAANIQTADMQAGPSPADEGIQAEAKAVQLIDKRCEQEEQSQAMNQAARASDQAIKEGAGPAEGRAEKENVLMKPQSSSQYPLLSQAHKARLETSTWLNQGHFSKYALASNSARDDQVISPSNTSPEHRDTTSYICMLNDGSSSRTFVMMGGDKSQVSTSVSPDTLQRGILLGSQLRASVTKSGSEHRRRLMRTAVAPSACSSMHDQQPATGLVHDLSPTDIIHQTADRLFPEFGLSGKLNAPFMQAGLQSRHFQAFAGALSRNLGFSVKAPIFFSHPTLRSLAQWAERVARGGEGSAIESLTKEGRLQVVSAPVHVQSACCALPGGISSVQDLESTLACSADQIQRVPPSRWNAEAWTTENEPGKVYTDQGGFLGLGVVEGFDHSYFAISAAEVKSMDPAQRLVLEHVAEALQQATGGQLWDLAVRSVAVYVGSSHHDWERLSLHRTSVSSPYNNTGMAPSILAGRVSFEFGLVGPAMVIDTACSSSLVACGLGYNTVREAGACTHAIVAGVNLLLDPSSTVLYCDARMLAQDGRCKTFDARADGYVRSEGCVSLVLGATSSTGTVQLVGHATNQDGKSSNLTSPSTLAQQRVIETAISQSILPPYSLACSESHGTGTALGDPIELTALGAVFQQQGVQSTLRVGALKSLLGHLEAAAGLASLVKQLGVASKRVSPSNLHLRRLNSHIGQELVDLELVELVLPTTAVLGLGHGSTDYLATGISSFGMSGTNSYAVLSHSTEETAEFAATALQSVDGIAYRHVTFNWWVEDKEASHEEPLLSTLGHPDEPSLSGTRWQRSWPAASYIAQHRVGWESSRSPASLLSFEYYAPNLCCPTADIEQYHSCQGRYTVGRGQQHVGFCSGEEDTVSMAMTVFERLVRSTGLGLEEIGRLEVGTESQMDRAKSTKSFLMEFFQPEGLHSVEGLDTYNACYGGTNALFSTVGWVQSAAWSGQYGVVLCSDPAVHPQQEALSGIGASAVGLLVGCEQRLPEF